MTLLEDNHVPEVRKLLGIIVAAANFPGGAAFSGKEIEFVRSMMLRMERGQHFTRKMVFWLRDIRDKCE